MNSLSARESLLHLREPSQRSVLAGPTGDTATRGLSTPGVPQRDGPRSLSLSSFTMMNLLPTKG